MDIRLFVTLNKHRTRSPVLLPEAPLRHSAFGQANQAAFTYRHNHTDD